MKRSQLGSLITALLIVIIPTVAMAASANMPARFTYLDETLDHSVYDTRYCTDNNFIGTRIDGYRTGRIILSEKAASALKLAEKDLVVMGLAFKIYDGYRPQQAVNHFQRWALDASDTKMKKRFYPKIDKGELFPLGYIARRSGHSRGSTVDLTLIELKTGSELDMGSPFDFFGEISHHDTKLISETQTRNREILKHVMLKHDFAPYANEWWHYTLRNEPYPDTYFDFIVQ